MASVQGMLEASLAAGVEVGQSFVSHPGVAVLGPPANGGGKENDAAAAFPAAVAKQKERYARAVRERDQGRATVTPRTLEAIKEHMAAEQIPKSETSTVNTRAEAVVRGREWSEVLGKMSSKDDIPILDEQGHGIRTKAGAQKREYLRNDAEHVSYRCQHPSCSFRARFRRQECVVIDDGAQGLAQDSNSKWELREFMGHSCDDPPIRGPRQPQCNYSAAMLAPLFREDFLSAAPGAEATTLTAMKNKLKAYVNREMCEQGIVKRIKRLARQNLYGSKAEQLGMIHSAIEVLRKDGHSAEVEVQNAEEHCETARECALMRMIDRPPEAEGAPPPQPAATSQADTAPAGSTFFYGFHVAWCHCSQALDSLDGVLVADCVPVDGHIQGTLFATVGFDAEGAPFPLAITFLWGPSNEKAWQQHFAFLARHYEGDLGPRWIISGKSEGSWAALKAAPLGAVGRFCCADGVDAELKEMGYLNDARDLFRAAVLATDPGELASQRARMPDNMLKHLEEKYLDQELYLSSGAGTCGRSTTEEGRAFLTHTVAQIESQVTGPLGTLVHLVYAESERVAKNKERADARAAEPLPTLAADVQADAPSDVAQGLEAHLQRAVQERAREVQELQNEDHAQAERWIAMWQAVSWMGPLELEDVRAEHPSLKSEQVTLVSPVGELKERRGRPRGAGVASGPQKRPRVQQPRSPDGMMEGPPE